MGVTTGLPSMGPLSICIYYFTMASTALSTNLFIYDFSDICVNMMFVATLMNESVSYFESCYLIKKFLTCIPYHKKTLPIGLFLLRRSTFLVYFQRYSRLQRLYLMGTSRLPHLFPAQISLLLETSKHLPLYL